MANKHVKLGKGPKPKEIERALPLLSNEPTELKKSTLRMIYQAVDFVELGYMDGRDPDTGEIVPLLVGLQPESNGSYGIYPLARFYMGKDIPNFEPPDGRGNYVTRNEDGSFTNSGESGESASVVDTPIGEFVAETQGGTTEGIDEASVEVELGGHNDPTLRRGSE